MVLTPWWGRNPPLNQFPPDSTPYVPNKVTKDLCLKPLSSRLQSRYPNKSNSYCTFSYVIISHIIFISYNKPYGFILVTDHALDPNVSKHLRSESEPDPASAFGEAAPTPDNSTNKHDIVMIRATLYKQNIIVTLEGRRLWAWVWF